MQDKLDIMIALVAKDCGQSDIELLNSLDTSTVKLSRRFYRKQARVISKYRHRKARILCKQIAIRVAVALMVLLSLAFITVMAVEPLREAIFQAVVEWYDDYLVVRYDLPDGDSPANENGIMPSGVMIPVEPEAQTAPHDSETAADESESLAEEESTAAPGTSGTQSVRGEQTPPAAIRQVRKPTYLPDGVEERVMLESQTMIYVDYYVDGNWMYSFMQEVWTGSDLGFNNEGASVEHITINEYEAMLVVLDETTQKTIVWHDGEYVYSLSFVESNVEDMVAIAESVS